MDEQKVRKSIKDAYGMLKDFQKSTVENVLYNLYDKDSPEDRHLVADEVGLGKTIVAKGVIAKRVQKILNSDDLEKRFRVVYICSNQAIARQNIHKLNVFGGRSLQRTNMDRLVFLALNDKTKTYSNGLDFQITALTPSTSFEVKKGTGIRSERKLIWLLLTHDEDFRRNGRKEGLKYALLGNVTPDKQWSDEVDRYAQKHKSYVVQEIKTKFQKQIQKKKINLSKNRYSIIKEELNYRDDQKTIQEILIDYSELLTVNNVESKYTGQKKILGRLREILTEICTDYLEADLFILDEFQRFKKLIDTVKEDEEKLSDAAKIAKKVFDRTDAKVLMLSATPFKPYSTSLEQELGESHFEEFKTVLEFLINDEHGDKLNNFADLNQKVREVLRRPNSFLKGRLKEPIESKNKLESIYQKVVSRTERIIVSEDKNTMLQSKRFPNSVLSEKEIEHFRAVDSLAQTLKEEGIGGYFNMMKYFKSCPYTFSYLDGYKIKEELKEALETNNSTIEKGIRNNSGAWLDLKEIRNYSLDLSESPNLKLRNFGATAFENNLWKQLWLPPSLPYYTQRGAFKGAENSSKMLLFSKWRMVPRMISSLISYEAERSVLTNLAKDEKDELSYFKNSDSSRRTPSPILQLKTDDTGPASMRTFTLLYPSLTLSGITTVRENAHEKVNSENDYFRLKNRIKENVKAKIKEANIQQFANKKKVSPDWYWAAPILLDKYYYPDVYDSWLTNRRIENSLIYGNRDIKHFGDAISDDKSTSTTKAYIEEIIKLYENPSSYELGGFPDIEKLAEALSLMVLGSPANSTFRTFELFYNTDEEHEETTTHLNYALDIAYEFRSLFDKPESISIIRNFNSGLKGEQTSSNTYWYNVLQYCVDGNLQAVFDEYGHALNSESDSKEYFFERFIKTINIRTSLIKVDDASTVLEGESKKLRCHYAVPFGNQNMDSETGKKRVQNVLENFNSPFRPFILASTSLGQEGLDFHHYCRKVVHWNLPHNPVDLEQREGRVNRFKCLAIRQNLVKKYSDDVISKDENYRHTDIWEALFSYAKEEEKESPDLIPYWHLEGRNGDKDQVSIERIVPLFPYSKEEPKFEELKKTLALYRLTFGQPRQEELVDALSDTVGEEELKKIRENLMINLCPHVYD